MNVVGTILKEDGTHMNRLYRDNADFTQGTLSGFPYIIETAKNETKVKRGKAIKLLKKTKVMPNLYSNIVEIKWALNLFQLFKYSGVDVIFPTLFQEGSDLDIPKL